MNINNFKIGTQLKLGFAALMLFVLLLGAVAYQQTDEIQQQIEDMYYHPLLVRRAIGTLSIDVLQMRLQMRGLPDAKNEQDIHGILEKVDLFNEDLKRQLVVLYEQYLGPRANIDSLAVSITLYETNRAETIRLIHAGKIQEANERLGPNGIGGAQVAAIFDRIGVIGDFAQSKGDSLFANSHKLKIDLNRQLLLFLVLMLLLSLLVNYVILKSIRKPLIELTDVARRFQAGDLGARSSYSSTNEFGVLSATFNALAGSIQVNSELDQKIAGLAGLMLSEYDARKFFQATLNAMAKYTGSQMAAIYLLSDDKKSFDHFESVGIDDNARQSFRVDTLEGEFGAAIASKKVQHIQNIPNDTRFVFHTVSGRFIPAGIITIPIQADNDVVAIISLAGITHYSQQSLQLIESILVTLCARVEGIMAYHKIKEFSGKLEMQNRELETRETELASQSAELMEQNTELEIQKKQLGEANRLKTNFLSNMSHELRTPLNSVIALSGVLSRRLAHKIPDEEYSYLEVIERNGRHLLELINDVLDISRIEAGQEVLEMSSFRADRLIADVVGMILPQAQLKHIELLFDEKDFGFEVISDITKCRHILQNLVSNAVKFTEKGKVEITARQNGPNAEIIVTDSGIGIAEEHQPHIFDEFRQADSSTSRRFGGTGLGLAIARKYAGLLGGTLSVKSAVGKGSEFTFSLPLRDISVNSANAHKAPAPALTAKWPVSHIPVSVTSVKTILLVEDSEPAIIQLKDMLEDCGYNILVARHGGEALAILDHTIPDAMILDLMMPGTDGFEVLRTLRNAEPTAHVPVLILTAKQISSQELGFLKRNNIHQLIQKGDINRSELIQCIAAMVTAKPKSETKPQGRRPNPVGRPVVLVVEDNPDNMLTVKAVLADAYTVLEAVNGKIAVEMTRQHRPDLVLMDIALPAMDGIEAFKLIRSDPHLQQIPVVALTASAMISDREAILAHGFDGYIAKPIDRELFFKTINEVLYGR